MRFAYTRLITDDLQRRGGDLRRAGKLPLRDHPRARETPYRHRLAAFYEEILGIKPQGTPVFMAFRMDGADLGLFARTAADKVHGGEWTPGANRSAIIEFLVDDVDAEHRRLEGVVADWLHGPKDMPWGNRSMMFRDPDGNVVNFYRPIAPA